jgi:hypothetical protein
MWKEGSVGVRKLRAWVRKAAKGDSNLRKVVRGRRYDVDRYTIRVL